MTMELKTTPSERREALSKAYAKWKLQFQQVPDISAPELHAALNAEKASDKPQSKALVLVDVRSVPEQQVSVLPGNTFTKEEFEQQKGTYAPDNCRVVTYCTAGYRSLVYAKQLQEQGYEVSNLAGSILAWTQEGYPLVEYDDRSKHTRKVHGWAPQWAAMRGDGYEAVVFEESTPARLVSALKSSLGGVTKWLWPGQKQ